MNKVNIPEPAVFFLFFVDINMFQMKPENSAKIKAVVLMFLFKVVTQEQIPTRPIENQIWKLLENEEKLVGKDKGKCQ